MVSAPSSERPTRFKCANHPRPATASSHRRQFLVKWNFSPFIKISREVRFKSQIYGLVKRVLCPALPLQSSTTNARHVFVKSGRETPGAIGAFKGTGRAHASTNLQGSSKRNRVLEVVSPVGLSLSDCSKRAGNDDGFPRTCGAPAATKTRFVRVGIFSLKGLLDSMSQQLQFVGLK